MLAAFVVCDARAAELRDFFADRELLTETNGVLNGSNAGATREPDEPRHGDKEGGASLWISWVAPTNGIAKFRTTGSSFDTLLSAYYFKPGKPEVLGELEEVAANDDDPANEPTSLVQFAAQAGVRYEIAVDGYRGATGAVVLAWEFQPLSIAPIIVSVPTDQAFRLGDTVTLSVDVQTTPDMRLQWRFNGESTEVEGPTLVIPSLQATNVGRYSLRIRIDLGEDEARFETRPVEIQINSDGRTNALARDKIFDSLESPLEPGDDDHGGSADKFAPSKLSADPAIGAIGVVAGYNGSQIFNTTFATPDPNEPAHCGVAGGASYWYAYRAPTNGTLFLDTIGSTFNTVLAVYLAPTGTFTYQDLVQLACNNDGVAPLGPSRVQLQVEAGEQIFVVVDGVNGARGIARLNYRLQPASGGDSNAPTLKVTSPPAAAPVSTTNGQFLLRGTASDDVALSNVVVVADGGAVSIAEGTNNWSLLAELHPGTNTFSIRARDITGNESATVERRVIRHVMQPLTLTRVGSGTVRGATNGQFLVVNRAYSLTAAPGRGQVFRGWSGDVTSAASTVRFVMQSNTALTAEFIPNPFAPVAGSFRGVFCDTNALSIDSAGLLSLSLRTSGAFSGSVQQSRGRHPFSGRFDADGRAAVSVSRAGADALALQLGLDFSAGVITGRVAGANWATDLFAGRADFSAVRRPATNFSGRYTFLVSGAVDSALAPVGDGFGTILVRTSGQATFSGTLANGTRFIQAVPLARLGDAAVFLPLHQGQGFLSGRLRLRPSPGSDLEGEFCWLVPPAVPGSAYTNGFALRSPAAGSAFNSTNSGRVLNLETARMIFDLGDDFPLLTNTVMLGASGAVTNGGPQPLAMVIDSRTGALNGTVQFAGATNLTAFQGTVLQRQAAGAGWFALSNRVGRVFLTE